MKILILGRSSIFKRRILPALKNLSSISDIKIASVSQKADWNSYEQALEESQADIVYISLANSFHYKWAKKALELGKHVIIDKPATSSLKQAKYLLNLAKRKKLLLAEATVYTHHPQINFLKSFDKINKISLNFSFPAFKKNNYRYSKGAGGGAIEDLGPYAMSVGRLFFSAKPKEVFVKITDKKNTLPISFSFLANYPKNKVIIGNCGFNSAYVNNMMLIGTDLVAKVDRIFTTPVDLENNIKINNKTKKIKAADSFEVFLKSAINAILKKDWDDFYQDFIDDAIALETLRKAV